ncbi:MAG: MerR family transcriptional regulator [Dehalococcoidia bacterium]|nr:MerR family transcriptional regulator [Dehalococcoidia bacterium]
MTALAAHISIGDLAARSGVATSALRFYESRGLIRSVRTDGNQRRYARAALRRVAFIRAAQQVGLSLDEIRTALTTAVPTDDGWYAERVGVYTAGRAPTAPTYSSRPTLLEQRDLTPL